MQRQIPRIRQWLEQEIWNDGKASRLVKWARIPLAAVLGFQRQQCVQKSAALTFSTLLAFIPLLAIMFALLKGLGVHNAMEPLLLKHFSVISEDVVTMIIGYINNTNVTRLGTVGLVMLVFTVLALISTIEKTFNSLWQVDETRTWFRRFADYFSVVTLGPLFLLAAVSINTSLQNQQLVQWLLSKPVFGDALLLLFEVLPFLAIWVAFIFLYLFVPNTKVKIASAAVGGITAGTLWLITQWGYVNFQYGVAKYNAIYGTMAALPIFMVWIYLSWMIALLGLKLCWAHQNRERLGRLLRRDRRIPWQPLQVLELLVLIYNRFQRGAACWQVDELLDQLEMPASNIHAALRYLQQQGVVMILRQDAQDQELIVPQRLAQQLVLAELLRLTPGENTLCPEVAVVSAQVEQLWTDCIHSWQLLPLLHESAAPQVVAEAAAQQGANSC